MAADEIWWRPHRTVGDVEIFAVDLSPHPDREIMAREFLDAEETVRYEKFRVETARRQFLLCRAGLRRLLGRRLNQPPARLSFAKTEQDKPYAVIDGVAAPVSFNISHSLDDGLIAITDSRAVGVDLELRRPTSDLDDIGAHVFGAEERKALARSDGTAKTMLFFRLWTCKEALIKAKGTGFSYDPARFQIPMEILHGARTARFCFPEEAAEEWVLHDLGTKRYAAALAYRD